MNTNPPLSWRCRPSPSMMLATVCLAVWNIAALPVPGAEAKPAGSIKIDAWTFDRGNGWVTSNPDM